MICDHRSRSNPCIPGVSQGIVRAPVPYDVPRLPRTIPGLITAGDTLAAFYREMGVLGGGGGTSPISLRQSHNPWPLMVAARHLCAKGCSLGSTSTTCCKVPRRDEPASAHAELLFALSNVACSSPQCHKAVVGTPTEHGASSPRRTVASLAEPLLALLEVPVDSTLCGTRIHSLALPLITSLWQPPWDPFMTPSMRPLMTPSMRPPHHPYGNPRQVAYYDQLLPLVDEVAAATRTP